MEYGSRIVPPKLTTVERDALPVLVGGIIYNTTTNTTQQWNGTAWVDLSSSAPVTIYRQFLSDNATRTTTSTAAVYPNITSVTLTGLTIGVSYSLNISVEAANGNAGQKSYCRVFLGATQVLEGTSYANVVGKFQISSGLATFTATATTQVVQLTGAVSGNTGSYRNFRVLAIQL
jgi:hypothetical protein